MLAEELSRRLYNAALLPANNGDLFEHLVRGHLRTSPGYVPRAFWRTHASDTIRFFAFGCFTALSVGYYTTFCEDDVFCGNLDLRITVCVARDTVNLVQLQYNHKITQTSWHEPTLERFLSHYWPSVKALEIYASPSHVPWEIATIVDPDAQAAALTAYWAEDT